VVPQVVWMSRHSLPASEIKLRKPTVTEYRLSPAALSDLDAIWDFTARIWSVGQAETYIRAIASDMFMLVRNPENGRERLEIRSQCGYTAQGLTSSSIGSRIAGWTCCVSCMRGKTGPLISTNDHGLVPDKPAVDFRCLMRISP